MQQLEQFLVDWLGDPTQIGSGSWFEILAWLAALFGLGVAVVSLRRQSFQSRAMFLLHLYERWEAQATGRRKFSAFFLATRDATLKQHAGLKNKHQIEHLRTAFCDELTKIKTTNLQEFHELIAYVSFFEVVGAYVKNRYIPIRDVTQLYKGSILDLDLACRDFIEEWQQEAHMAPGLLKYTLYLASRMRRREDYWYARWIF